MSKHQKNTKMANSLVVTKVLAFLLGKQKHNYLNHYSALQLPSLRPERGPRGTLSSERRRRPTGNIVGLGENDPKLGGFSGWLRGLFQLFLFKRIRPTEPQVWHFQLIPLNSLLTDKPYCWSLGQRRSFSVVMADRDKALPAGRLSSSAIWDRDSARLPLWLSAQRQVVS